MKLNPTVNDYLFRAYNEPWLVHAPYFYSVLSSLENREGIFSPSLLDQSNTTEKQGKSIIRMRDDGIAIVSIQGPLFRYDSCASWLFGGTSYDQITSAIEQLQKDPNIKGILAVIDSPGGEANGCYDTANLIYKMRTGKPMVAFYSGLGASAAFWLGSSFSKTVASKTSELGSIGVVCEFIDDRKKKEKEGVTKHTFTSDQSPYKRFDPSTEEGKAIIKEKINDLAQIFVDSVSLHLNFPQAKVISDFGKGSTLLGEKAVKAGMATMLGDFDSSLKLLKEMIFSKNKTNTGYSIMDKDEILSKYPEAAKALISDGEIKGRAEGKTEGERLGIEFEQKRIQSIAGLYKGHDPFAKIVIGAIADPTKGKVDALESLLEAKTATPEPEKDLSKLFGADAAKIPSIGSDPGAQNNIQAETASTVKATNEYLDSIYGKTGA